MPNWCNNNLTLTGPVDQVEAALLAARGQEGETISLQTILPVPDDLMRAEEVRTDWPSLTTLVAAPTRSEDDSAYAWRVRNWGTKWDVDAEVCSDEMLDATVRSVLLQFSSAWAPPLGAIEKWARQFSAVEFKMYYHEPGMDFGGEMYVHGDKVEFKEYESPSNIFWTHGVPQAPDGSYLDDEDISAASQIIAEYSEPVLIQGEDTGTLSRFLLPASLASELLAALPAWWSSSQVSERAPTASTLVQLAASCSGRISGWVRVDDEMSGVSVAGFHVDGPLDDERQIQFMALAKGLSPDVEKISDQGVRLDWEYDPY